MNGLWTALSLDPAVHRCVTFVGGGGKTSTMYALAQACRLAGKTVVITTTTHIMPHPRLPLTDSAGALPALLAAHGIATLGARQNGKLTGTGEIGMALAAADVVLVEGDGARLHPLKAPADHEPVIPPESQAVVAVAGLDALGQPIGTICHRPQQVCALLGQEMDHLITTADVSLLLSHPLGGRKYVTESMAFRCLLNKADDARRRQAGKEIASLLARQQIPCGVTYFTEEERGGACWF